MKRSGEFIGISFEAAVRKGNVGKPFPECYDVERCESTDEYKRIYAEAKNDLREQGMPFKY
jgi:hypothetical protein